MSTITCSSVRVSGLLDSVRWAPKWHHVPPHPSQTQTKNVHSRPRPRSARIKHHHAVHGAMQSCHILIMISRSHSCCLRKSCHWHTQAHTTKSPPPPPAPVAATLAATAAALLPRRWRPIVLVAVGCKHCRWRSLQGKQRRQPVVALSPQRIKICSPRKFGNVVELALDDKVVLYSLHPCGRRIEDGALS